MILLTLYLLPSLIVSLAYSSIPVKRSIGLKELALLAKPNRIYFIG